MKKKLEVFVYQKNVMNLRKMFAILSVFENKKNEF